MAKATPDHGPRAVDQRRARVARAPGRPTGRTRRARCCPGRRCRCPGPGSGGRSRRGRCAGPRHRGTRRRRRGRPSSASPSGSAGRSRPGTSSRARSRSGSKATTVAVGPAAVGAHHLGRAVPGHDVGVGGHELVGHHEPTALLEPAAGLALDPDGRRRHPVGHCARDAGAGRGVAEVRGRPEGVEDVREAVVADELPEGGERVRRGGEDGVDGAGDAASSGPGRRATPARWPWSAGSARAAGATPTTPATAPTVLSTVRAEPSGIATRSRPPTRSPRAWPRKPPPTRRATTTKNAWVSLADSSRSRAGGQDPGGEVDAADHADPRGGPGDEAEAPRRHARRQTPTPG